MSAKMGMIDRRRRLRALLDRDNGRCWICGGTVELRGEDERWRPTIDHVKPRASGGSHDLSNLRLAHYFCNNQRGRDGIKRARKRVIAVAGARRDATSSTTKEAQDG